MIKKTQPLNAQNGMFLETHTVISVNLIDYINKSYNSHRHECVYMLLYVGCLFFCVSRSFFRVIVESASTSFTNNTKMIMTDIYIGIRYTFFVINYLVNIFNRFVFIQFQYYYVSSNVKFQISPYPCYVKKKTIVNERMNCSQDGVRKSVDRLILPMALNSPRNRDTATKLSTGFINKKRIAVNIR